MHHQHTLISIIFDAKNLLHHGHQINLLSSAYRGFSRIGSGCATAMCEVKSTHIVSNFGVNRATLDAARGLSPVTDH